MYTSLVTLTGGGGPKIPVEQESEKKSSGSYFVVVLLENGPPWLRRFHSQPGNDQVMTAVSLVVAGVIGVAAEHDNLTASRFDPAAVLVLVPPPAADLHRRHRLVCGVGSTHSQGCVGGF